MLPDELLAPLQQEEDRAAKNGGEVEVMRQAAADVTEIIAGDRNRYYGCPSENHSVTGDMWSAYLSRRLGMKVKISGSDVCWMLILQKASRQAHRPKRDNALDVGGYAFNSLACEYAEGIQNG